MKKEMALKKPSTIQILKEDIDKVIYFNLKNKNQN